MQLARWLKLSTPIYLLNLRISFPCNLITSVKTNMNAFELEWRSFARCRVDAHRAWCMCKNFPCRLRWLHPNLSFEFSSRRSLLCYSTSFIPTTSKNYVRRTYRSSCSAIPRRVRRRHTSPSRSAWVVVGGDREGVRQTDRGGRYGWCVVRYKSVRRWMYVMPHCRGYLSELNRIRIGHNAAYGTNLDLSKFYCVLS